MKTKQLIASILCIATLLLLTPRAAFANSAPKFWRGADAYGSVAVNKDCPITVEHELLTFDIPDFPEQYGKNNNYNANVTAEYTFFNPTEDTITARLEFPFGAAPNYDTGKNGLSKYDITVNGSAIEKTVRHTIMPEGRFVLDRDIANITDGFKEDDFFTPELPVTKYVYEIVDYNKDYRNVSVAFDFHDSYSSKFFLERTDYHFSFMNGVRLSTTAYQETATVYVFGEQPGSPPEGDFYTDRQCSVKTDGTLSLVSTETMTFRELVMSIYPEKSSPLEEDWYNAVVDDLNIHNKGSYNCVIEGAKVFDTKRSNLLRWYEYEITIPPGERIVNAVTAPIYPTINEGVKPALFSYTYLLSPAQSWADFGSLDVVINTPYYLRETGTDKYFDSFESTETGYKASFDGLPEGELEFSLKSKKGSFFVNPPYPDIPEPWGTVILIAIIAAVIAGVVFLTVSSARRLKRK